MSLYKYCMKYVLGVMLFLLTSLTVSGQVAVKTNLLYDATTTPNIGVEVGIGGKSTLNLVYGLNPWTFSSHTHGDRYVKHWVAMPEYRWWTCTRFSGHFFGVHAFGGEMNAANVSLPIPGKFFSGVNLTSAVKSGRRYQGQFIGAGLTYGYQWAMSRHWNLEAEIGAGYGHVWYDRYPCGTCGRKIDKGQTNYVGVTKLALSIIYVF